MRETLIELNLPLVRYAARRFGARVDMQDDIVQVGTIGLINAIDRYDVERGVEFAGFAMPTIIGEIKHFFRDATWAVHVPRRLQDLRPALADARARLEQRLDRAPTVAELAEHLALSREQVVEAISAGHAYTATSLDAPPEGIAAHRAIDRFLGFEDGRLARVDDLRSLQPLIAGLPERERLILHLRFTEELAQTAIAQRLGISQMHVSRLLSHTLAALRTGLTGERASHRS